MKLENIIKNLRREGQEVYIGQFDYTECWMCNGTALIDLSDGIVISTNAKYSDVKKQIEENRSHIYTIDSHNKMLNSNLKWQG